MPPPKKVEKASQWALACMNGGTGRATMPKSRRREGSSPGSVMALPIWSGSPPPMAAKKMSSWRHSTPLGAPVVPPV